MILAPILQLFVLAYAATTDIRNVPVVVADADRSAASRELIAAIPGVAEFHIGGGDQRPNDVDRYLEHGDAWMAVAIPAGLRRGDRHARRRASVQIIADGSDANSAGVSLGYATNLIAGYGQEFARRRSDRAAAAPARAGSLEPRVRVWFNPRLQSRDFMIPGDRRAAAARHHDQPVGDGHRPRTGGRHARATERYAAPPLGADHRQAAAVRPGRAD